MIADYADRFLRIIVIGAGRITQAIARFLLLLLGRIAVRAFVLAGFLIPATLTPHAFWLRTSRGHN